MPLAVSFDASASSDPDTSDTIVAYLWDFGDGATRETVTPTISYAYQASGIYTATLQVRDSRGATSANVVQARIDVGNAPPQPQISLPAEGALFVEGQQLVLIGAASDAEDGAVPSDQLRWEVRRHHAEHYHPYHSAAGATTSFIAPGPEDLYAVDTSYLEIRLTATDSAGRSATVSRVLQPEIVELRFETSPPGLRVAVDGGTNGNTIQTPGVVRSWPGFVLSLGLPAGQISDGVAYTPCGWTHTGGLAASLTTPTVARTYTAVFAPAGVPCEALMMTPQIALPIVVSQP
jgi:PKD repeat protein